jgi:hypothetical protein
MKSFRSIAIVEHPVDRVLPVMRDSLPELAAQIDDVSSITAESRSELSDGSILLVNRWESATRIPGPLTDTLGAQRITWLDKARWSPNGGCTWEIEPNVLAKHIVCSGRTTFESAMAGRGTRILFEGTFVLRTDHLAGAGMYTAIAPAIEFLASGVIPRSFQQVTRAVARRLGRAPAPP